MELFNGTSQSETEIRKFINVKNFHFSILPTSSRRYKVLFEKFPASSNFKWALSLIKRQIITTVFITKTIILEIINTLLKVFFLFSVVTFVPLKMPDN